MFVIKKSATFLRLLASSPFCCLVAILVTLSRKLEAEQAEEDKAKLIEAFTVSGKGIDMRGTVLCVLTESRLHVFGPATTDHVLSCDCARFLKSRHPPEFQQR